MHHIAVAFGDGIGPEIMGATLHILKEAGAPLKIEEVEIGEKVYLRGEKAGIAKETWDVLRNTKAFLKAPITTPQGGGFKSLNVTVRTTLGLFANIRPCVSYAPFVSTKHPHMDLVIVRENEEDLYTGIEYRRTDDLYQALKYITTTGSERIIRYAFAYAEAHGRKKVTCFTKDNILKISDGEFHKVFERIAKEYPHITAEHWIVDIGAAKLADTPEAFDVVVLPNLYGDILSDVAAEIAGSVGLAGSANIGTQGAMFEAIHGSAPRRAGQDVANPSGLLLASLQMLDYLGENKIANLIENAWLRTLEEGIHTYDIFEEGKSKINVGTKAFAEAVVKRLGQKPEILKPRSLPKKQLSFNHPKPPKETEKKLIGIDISVEWKGSLDNLLSHLKNISDHFELKMVGNRGVKVWPNPLPETTTTDEWRLRFVTKKPDLTQSAFLPLLDSLSKKPLRWSHLDPLYTFDNTPGYTLSQEEQ